jgi:hypothetical protein
MGALVMSNSKRCLELEYLQRSDRSKEKDFEILGQADCENLSIYG